MAIPIRSIPSSKPSSEEVLAKLDAAEVQHAEAILDAYELLQALHERGVIDKLRGVVGAGDTIITKLALAANAEETTALFRNVVSLSRILSTVDPDFLRRLSEELTAYSHNRQRKIGVWTAARMLFGNEGRRAIVGASAFVRAFGRALARPH
jgi:uncharacterized protein YjgD (DUF1641 family)